MMFIDNDVVGDVQPESCAFTRLFGCEKRFEYPLLYRIRYSRAIIGYGAKDLFGSCPCFNFWLFAAFSGMRG